MTTIIFVNNPNLTVFLLGGSGKPSSSKTVSFIGGATEGSIALFWNRASCGLGLDTTMMFSQALHLSLAFSPRILFSSTL
jgi:hypothetical protein